MEDGTGIVDAAGQEIVAEVEQAPAGVPDRPKDGIGLMVQGGMVYIHLFAVQQTIELMPEDALDFAAKIEEMATVAMDKVMTDAPA